MGYPSPAELSEKTGNQFLQAAQLFQQAREQKQALERQEKLEQDLQRFADPNTSSAEKARILASTGDLNAMLKYEKQRGVGDIIQKYKNLNAPDRLDHGKAGQVDAASEAGLVAPPSDQTVPQRGSPSPFAQKDTVKQPASAFEVDQLRNERPSKISDKFQIPPEARSKSTSPELRAQENELIQQLAALDPTTANILQKQSGQRLKEEQAEQKSFERSHEASKDYRQGVIDQYKSMKRNNAIVDRMLEISDDPNETSTPAFTTLMNKLGIPIGVLGSSSDQELEKLAGELTKELPASWRGRILASEFATLLRTIPSLQNTPEGRKAIIRNMKILMEPAKLEYEAMREILNEYDSRGLKHPYNLDQLVFDRIEPQMDQLYADFVRGEDIQNTLAEKIKPGSTKSEEEKISSITVPQGRVRLTDGKGGYFDVPEEAVKAAMTANKHLKRVS